MKQNWEYKKLGDVCDIICGQDYKAVLDDNGKYPIYGTGGIMGYASEYRCPANSVIIGRKGSINNPLFVESEFWNVDTAFGMVPNKQFLNAKYFFYFCRNYDFTRHNVAVTIPSLRRIDLVKIPVPVPPLAEQQRIVAELDLLTGIIDKLKAQLKELDTLAQSIFYDMFGDPIENEKGWPTNTIQSIALKYTDGPFGSNLKSEHYQESGVRIIRLQNIGVNEFVDTDKAFISEEHYKTLEKYTCYPGDIVIGTLGEPNLRACIVPQNIERAVNKADCVLCRVRKEIVSEIYLCRVLNEKKFVEAQCQLFSHGQTRARISAGQLKNTYIPIPPLTLQQEFADKIQSIEKQKAAVNQSIAETQTLLDYTMDKYFG